MCVCVCVCVFVSVCARMRLVLSKELLKQVKKNRNILIDD